MPGTKNKPPGQNGVVISLAGRRKGKGAPPAKDDVLNALGVPSISETRRADKAAPAAKGAKQRKKPLKLKISAKVRREFRDAARVFGRGKGALFEAIFADWRAREAQDGDR